MEILTREQAQAIGSTVYFDGVPCRHGHLYYRYVSNGNCQICSINSSKRSKNPERGPVKLGKPLREDLFNFPRQIDDLQTTERAIYLLRFRKADAFDAFGHFMKKCAIVAEASKT
jgi:hypothetical protein